MTLLGARLCSHLRGWTPIAFRPDDGTVEWADLRDSAFDRPFFSRTLKRWQDSGGGPTARTDLSALAALDDEPCLEPDLIIAHPSRCGSTLLARLAAASVDRSILVSEPEILAVLLNHSLNADLGAPVEQVVRQIIRAQGRIRFGDERRHVVKLSSTMTRYLPVFRRAFPSAPMVWLQREPAEILESNIHNEAKPTVPMGPEAHVDWIARKVTLAFMAATAFLDDEAPVLDYRTLAHDPLGAVASLMRLTPSHDDLARMRAVTRLHGHNNLPYAPRPKQPLPESLLAVVRETLDPMYQALGARPAAAETPCL